MSRKSFTAAILAAFLASGCQTALPIIAEPAEVVTRNAAPPGAEPGTCWAHDETPAVVETVTEQVMVQPAEILDDGTIARPAAYRTETRQKIVTPRRETWFETPCDGQLTPEFNASLQRALAARGLYRGPITGRMDARTRVAVRAYQKPQGLDSGMISLAAARQMGLVEVKAHGVDREVGPSALDLAALEAQETLERERARELEAARKAAEEQAAQENARKAAAERARQEAAREAERAARAEKAKRQAELEAALDAERARKAAGFKPLPISSETP